MIFSTGDKSVLDHLRLLLNYVNSVYVFVSTHLIEFLINNDITYDLLWALFKSNNIIYICYDGTKESRCFKLAFVKKRKIKQRFKYFHVKDYYLDFDSKVLEKSRLVVDIKKF